MSPLFLLLNTKTENNFLSPGAPVPNLTLIEENCPLKATYIILIFPLAQLRELGGPGGDTA